MRKLWLVPALGLALLLVLLLLGRRDLWRGGGGRRGEEGEEATSRRAAVAAAAVAGEKTAEGPISSTAHEEGPPEVAVDGRLIYLDDAPAAGIELHLAVGRPLEARRFRNGEYTDVMVHLVTVHLATSTGLDGSFRFAPVREPARAHRFVYTKNDSPAFVVEELFGNGQTVRARRRVSVTGRFRGRDEGALKDLWFEAQLGRPEDWSSRVLREEDLFVSMNGNLEVDALGKSDARSRDDGSFDISLVEGRNTFTFGEAKTEGALPVEVPPHDTDVGELRVPGPEPRGEARSVSGVVLNLAGAPHVGCDVRAWDGSVGMHTHETLTDAEGAFTIDGLTGSFVILWAVSTDQPFVLLPSQTSGTLRPPCAPVTLRAPEEEEYAWTRMEAQGFYLLLRGGVLLGGAELGPADVVGLPPSPLKIIHLTPDARILEASLTVQEPGDLVLGLDRFRDTTWE